MAGKGVVRSIKNIAKGFSDVQIKVREATSNDPWGPSGTLMNEIAQLTFNESDFIEIMDMIDKRLNDKGKNWRHVFKALLLLDYCLHVGSENVVLYAKENIYVVKTLREFQHIDESGKDVGANVRQKAKDVTNLLMDDNRLREERRQRQGMRERMAHVGDYLNETVRQIDGGQGRYDEDADLQKAIAESKRIAEEEAKNRRQGDDDLEKAIQLSQQEALEKEKKERERLERENTQNLFGLSSFQAFPAQQNAAINNPYQQQQQQQQNPPLQLEWTTSNNAFSGLQNNPYQQTQNPYQSAFSPNTLQAQMTGFPQPTPSPAVDLFSQQPQLTGFPVTQQQQPQMTGFPATQQTTNNFLSTPSFQTSMVTGTNPFSQMNTATPLQPQQPQQQQQQSFDYSGLVFGNPQQQQQQQQQPSFSPKLNNNSNSPFNFASSPVTTNATTSAFTSSMTPTMRQANAFSSPQLGNSQTPFQSEADSKYAKLNSLLANKDDGMDTFGNQGNLRIPYGTGFANSIGLQNTGNNGTNNNANSFGSISRNPFGQAAANNNNNNKPAGQKSLLDLMQEQKQMNIL
ncbi:hypothetical protein CU097_015200 [Rhizopus azygosporus]|uniref:ENTH domain-containing protein n=2 Tax=Rhizopus TaxID=4842 RepID=A0A367K9X7_RHIAZ|nr:ENTH-domain-containing protein [Rhizopus microsporus]RCH98966.1 hypothetical protein CU097_015200 [Rhizopus azygosporus]